MEERKRVSYPLGMFDLVKGLGMIAIVFAHTTHELPVSQWIYYLIHGFNGGLMGVYYAINGFQFRPSASLRKAAGKHLKTYLSLYLRMAIVSLACMVINDPMEARQYLPAFFLGNLSPRPFGPYYLMYVSMGWFFLALCWSSILMELLLRIPKERVRIACIAVLWLFGVYLESVSFTFFSICRSFQALPCLYMGYCFYTRDLLNRPQTNVQKAIPYILFALTFPIGPYASQGPVWTLWLTAGCEIIWGCFALVFSRDTIRCSNGALETVRKMGRYTPWIVIMHSAEMLGCPWEKIPMGFIANENIVFFARVLFRSVFIVLGCMLMGKYDRLERQWKRKRRGKKRTQKKAVG